MITGPLGLIIAAPSSGQGKTLFTLGLINLLCQEGEEVAVAKNGPDYIDGRFLSYAAGRPALNLDSWAMRSVTISSILAQQGIAGANMFVIEGAMGLFDGAENGTALGVIPGSTADLAVRVKLPIVLVVDIARQGASVAALIWGFIHFRSDIEISGIILNHVGGARHEAIATRAIEALKGPPILGALPHNPCLTLPSRHLGLIQAEEHKNINSYCRDVERFIADHVNLPAVRAVMRPLTLDGVAKARPNYCPLPPLGQKIAVARDIAFSFSYNHILMGWREAGAEIVFFSPLADQPPPENADAVYLPGGYPELYVERLAACCSFAEGMRVAVARGANIWGECGGFMVLGQGIIDSKGYYHAAIGALPIVSSMVNPRLELGYREAQLLAATCFGNPGDVFRGHVFHYAHLIETEDQAPALFTICDAAGKDLGKIGLSVGRVAASFLHLIDRADDNS